MNETWGTGVPREAFKTTKAPLVKARAGDGTAHLRDDDDGVSLYIQSF